MLQSYFKLSTHPKKTSSFFVCYRAQKRVFHRFQRKEKALNIN